MSRKLVITIDVEPDLTDHLDNSYFGIELAMPKLLEILHQFEIRGEFFVTSDVLEKYPSLMKRVVQFHHNLGSHGYRHERLSMKRKNLVPQGNRLPSPFRSIQEIYKKRSFPEQLSELRKATDAFLKILGYVPKSFRAPNFSANHDTVKALEQLGYKVDSSVLPGRITRMWRLITISDFVGAPRHPYSPSYDNIAKVGNSKLIELPLTENPMFKGAPLGLGFLNIYGVKATIEAIMRAKLSTYVTFLIHPYELIDLKKYYPHFNRNVFKCCSDSLHSLTNLIECLDKKGYSFCHFGDLTQSY